MNSNFTEIKSESKADEESSMEQTVNRLNVETGDVEYIMYRFTFNSGKGNDSDITDKRLIAKLSREICSVVKKHINEIFFINGLSLGIENHSSKGKQKGEICMEHIHIHFKGTFRVLSKINNLLSKYKKITENINQEIKLILAMACECEKALFNNRSCWVSSNVSKWSKAVESTWLVGVVLLSCSCVFIGHCSSDTTFDCFKLHPPQPTG